MKSGIPMMEYLVSLGLDVDAMDDAIKIAEDDRGQHGMPLQYAIRHGRMEEAECLLKNGANPDKGSHGSTARDDVMRRRPEEQVIFLEMLERYGKTKGSLPFR